MNLIQRLEALYAELPEVACQGKCQSCCGPIDMSPGERKRIRALGIEIQPLTRDRIDRWEDDEEFDSNGESLRCNALNLTTGQCDVYEVRPMICRLWGLSTGHMACPFDCMPTKQLSDEEVMDYLMRSMVAGGKFSDEDYEQMRNWSNDPETAKLMAAYLHGDKAERDRLRATMTRY